MNATLARPRLAIAVAAAGCALLIARPLLLRGPLDATRLLTILFAALLVAGVGWPVAADGDFDHARTVPVLVLGVAAFALGRLLGGGEQPAALVPRIVALSTLAAVAEEAFFRRLLYAALAPGGAVVAVGGTALLFAVVHVTVYGMWVLPIDVAAGLVLSWQRWASGTWRVPAATHVIANLLVVL